jgi:hypothetical protein
MKFLDNYGNHNILTFFLRFKKYFNQFLSFVSTGFKEQFLLILIQGLIFRYKIRKKSSY